MSSLLLFSLVESPAHPDFSRLYRQLGLQQLVFTSNRKAMAALKKKPPDFVVAEFFYGYANNYAGVNISNLDVFLHSLQKYAPQARVIALASKQDFVHVDKLRALFPLHGVLQLPVNETQMQALLS